MENRNIVIIYSIHKLVILYLKKRFIVKPVLRTTSEKRSPVNNGQAKPDQTKLNSNVHWKHSTEQLPMYNGHFCVVPKVAVVDRFDCICYQFQIIVSLYFLFDKLMIKV